MRSSVGVAGVLWLWVLAISVTTTTTAFLPTRQRRKAIFRTTIQPEPPLLLLCGSKPNKKAGASSLSLRHATGGPDHDDEDIIIISSTSLSSSSSSSSSPSIAGPSRLSSPTASSWQSHVSTHPHAMSALHKVLGELGSDTSSATMDLVFLFVGPYHTEDFEDLVQACQEHFDATTTQVMAIIGAGGVIGEGIELDEPHRPSLSILAGRLPADAKVELAHHYRSSTSPSSVPLGNEKKKRSSYLVFGDPWSNTDQVLNELTTTAAIVAGGISCPANLAKVPSLAYNGNLIQPGKGVVTLQFSGSLQLQTLVSQGCRPISSSSTYTITAGEGNIIESLDGKPALQVLKEMVAAAPTSEVPLIESSLLGGILVHKESSSSLSSQDGNANILARQLVGFVPEIQGIAIAGRIQKGDQFVFQVRDAQSAQDDLKLMLQRAQMARLFYRDSSTTTNTQPLAALQISCVARGRSLYPTPNVDHSLIQSWLKEQGRDGSSNDEAGDLAMSRSGTSTSIPIGGFFANGEIGSVGLAGFAGHNDDDDEGGRVSYIHGFTTVVALLCETTTTTSSAAADDEEMDARATLETDRSDFDDAWG